MLRKWFIPMMVTLVAGLSIWLFQGQPVHTPPPVEHAKATPDSYMENFTTRIFDEQGYPHYELQATHMAHYPHDQHSEFTTPRFTAYRPNGQRWTLVAEQGTALNNTEKILLQGEVLMHRYPNTGELADLEIRTRDVMVRPDGSYAETDQPIVLVRSEATISKATLEAIGMQAHFREGNVKLLSQVRGRYVP